MAKPKLLVVDKSAIIINWVRAALEGDYEVSGVTSAMEAPGAIVRDEPALILIDPTIPVVGDGIVDLVRDAVANPRALIVLFSAQPGVELAEKARALGADGFIEKSGDAHSFARRVRGLNEPDTVVRREPRPVSTETKTILVAGRNWLAHGTLLPRAGFSLNAVATAKAVRDSLRAWRPAVLVVGPNLPDATVPDLCHAIRADPMLRRVSILFVGEAYDQARAQQAREAGANETLLRPLDEMTLFQAVGRLASVATRRAARLLVRIEIQVEQGGEFCVGFSHNVSASGMLLEADRPLDLEVPLKVRFFVPGCDEEIEAVADVVRVQERRADGAVVGVHVEQIDARLRDAIDEFVHAQGT